MSIHNKTLRATWRHFWMVGQVPVRISWENGNNLFEVACNLFGRNQQYSVRQKARFDGVGIHIDRNSDTSFKSRSEKKTKKKRKFQKISVIVAATTTVRWPVGSEGLSLIQGKGKGGRGITVSPSRVKIGNETSNKKRINPLPDPFLET